MNARFPDSSAVNLNAKFRCGLVAYRLLQELVRVQDRVRMREEIAQPQEDFAIVRVLRQRRLVIQPPRTNRASLQHELRRLFRVEFDACLLDFAIRQEPDKRFVVKIDHLNPVAPRIAKIAAKRRLQFEFILFLQFLSNFRQLRFIANHDPEMAKVCRLHLFYLENCEELMLTQFEKGIPFAACHLFEIENVLIKRHGLLDVAHLDGHMIASINLHAHILA
jgi:hypothetical protein